MRKKRPCISEIEPHIPLIPQQWNYSDVDTNICPLLLRAMTYQKIIALIIKYQQELNKKYLLLQAQLNKNTF